MSLQEPAYEPTPQEIEAAKAKIRAEWDIATELNRRGLRTRTYVEYEPRYVKNSLKEPESDG